MKGDPKNTITEEQVSKERRRMALAVRQKHRKRGKRTEREEKGERGEGRNGGEGRKKENLERDRKRGKTEILWTPRSAQTQTIHITEPTSIIYDGPHMFVKLSYNSGPTLITIKQTNCDSVNIIFFFGDAAY